ncbi:MipA/OmpV family protein [Pseudoalteromonas rubra]|uniref:MipA/OmpV family protein n=1 Tax=Pseudoalteromonas rubra TaxID=43658 RepID=UPI000F794007|nr:MipA/OmpV family protein [Pseudoalteromonas rubra]
MNKVMIRTLTSCLLLVGLNSQTLLAAESPKEQHPDSKGFLALGVGAFAGQSPFGDASAGLGYFVNGAYEWDNGLFVEVPGGPNNILGNTSVGYNLYRNTHWDVDFLASSARSDADTKYIQQDGSELRFTKNQTNYLGVRFRGIWSGLRFQLIVAPELSDDRGAYVSSQISKHWTIKNWHLFSAYRVNYLPGDMLNYYYGVNNTENNNNNRVEGLPEYIASSSLSHSLHLGATYPLTENWLFDASLRYYHTPSAIADSPLIQSNLARGDNRSRNALGLGLSVSYVF